MNISTKFITDNRKARLKKSKTYAEVLKSSQAQDYNRSGENVMNLKAIKKDLLSSENSSIISTSPPLHFVLIHHLLRIHQPINAIVHF